MPIIAYLKVKTMKYFWHMQMQLQISLKKLEDYEK